MLVEVKQEDINNGVTKSCGRCPIAIAIKRLIQPTEWVEVGSFGHLLFVTVAIT